VRLSVLDDTGEPHSRDGATVRRFRAMFMSTTPKSAIRELDHRTNDGIDVRLLWNSWTDRVFVAVEDQRSGELFEVTVPGTYALDAFHHPYAYGAGEFMPTVSTGMA
jgi:hypothetical protein